MNNKAISRVHLLSVPLENDYKNTLYFDSKETQESYFKSQIKHTFDNVSYQRKDFKFRCPKHIDELYNCNYVMYQNTYYNNRWFYGFIVNMTYISDGVTEIEIQTDVMQTWAFDYQVKASFVEREHVNDDTIGLHTYPENLETGDYVCNEVDKANDFDDMSYVIMVTEWVSEDNPKPLAVNYGGVFSSGGAYIVKTMSEVVNIIQAYQDGRGDAIIGVYMIPTIIVNMNSDTAQYGGQDKPVVITKGINKPTNVNNHKVRNNKLFTYPYNYLLMSNNTGVANILQYEMFSTDRCDFEMIGVPTIGGSVKCVPSNYKGIAKNEEESIMLGKFPTLSWSEDLYTNWLTQNAVNLGVGVASSGLTTLGGLALLPTGGGSLMGASMLSSGILGIASTLGQVYKHELLPNSAKGNVNGGDINTSNKTNAFFFYKMSIKKEIAEVIDSFFDMFGYKVCKVKEPNKNHRSRYWYTKTQCVNISSSNIPNNDLQMIKNVYDNGVTFWKNADDVENYSDANTIV